MQDQLRALDQSRIRETQSLEEQRKSLAEQKKRVTKDFKNKKRVEDRIMQKACTNLGSEQILCVAARKQAMEERRSKAPR